MKICSTLYGNRKLQIETTMRYCYTLFVYCLVAKQYPTLLKPHGLQPARLLCPWDFPGQEHWSGLPFPSPGDLPHPGIETMSPALRGKFFTTELSGKPLHTYQNDQNPKHCRYQMLAGIWSHRSAHTLLAGMQNGIATFKDRLPVS